MAISFNDNHYSIGNNGELQELIHSPSKIREMIELTGDYEFENCELRDDPELSSNDLLHVGAYSSPFMNDIVFIFNKYGIDSVKYPTGQVLYKNENVALTHNPMLADMIAAFTHSMIEINGEKYARSVEAYRKETLKSLERHLASLEESRMNTRKTENLIKQNKKILGVIQAMTNAESTGEK